MSKLEHLVFVYIGPYPICIDVHFHLRTLKIRLKTFLQVIIMILYVKQGYGSTHPSYRSKHIEGFFKTKVSSFYVSTHKSVRSTHNMMGLNHACLRLTHTEGLLKSKLLPSMYRHTSLLDQHIIRMGQDIISWDRHQLKFWQAKWLYLLGVDS